MAFIIRLKSFLTSQDDEFFAERTSYLLTHLPTLTWKGGWHVKGSMSDRIRMLCICLCGSMANVLIIAI